jgi:hypothetical protein
MPMRMIRIKSFPRIHVQENKFQLNANNSSVKNATIVPAIMQDEGLGATGSVYTNPQHASFAEVNEPNCYPESRVNYAKINLELGLTKEAIATDSVEVMKVMIVPIYMSFLENYTATNESTSQSVEDMLEMQHETTDRQGYPLFNGTKLSGDSPDLGTNMPGLTTNTNIEGVTFAINALYDGLQYFTNGGKIRKSMGRIKWLNISKRRNVRLSIRIKSKAKRMNPYTFYGVLIYVPKENEKPSMQKNGDLTDIDHIQVKTLIRYNEWNDNFNFERT